jgi:hypothetical protein
LTFFFVILYKRIYGLTIYPLCSEYLPFRPKQ